MSLGRSDVDKLRVGRIPTTFKTLCCLLRSSTHLAKAEDVIPSCILAVLIASSNVSTRLLHHVRENEVRSEGSR